MHGNLPTENGFERLAGVISRAAIDPSGWAAVLTEFGDQFPGLRLQIIGWDTAQGNTVPQYLHGYSDEFIAPYLAHFRHHNAWIEGWRSLPVGETTAAGAILDERALMRTEFYNDWVKPQEDMCGGGGVVLFRDSTRNFLFGGNIPKRLRESSEADFLRMVTRVTPLMQSALEVNRLMVALHLEQLALRQGVEPDGSALLLLGPGGVLVFANEKGWHLLDDELILRLTSHGRAAFVDQRADWALSEALAAGAAVDWPEFAAGPSGSALRAKVVSLSHQAVDGLRLDGTLLSQHPRAMLILRTAPSGSGRFLNLQRSAGLTEAEMAIAVAVADGLTLAEVAQQRRVSIHTVRNQVKSALDKTGGRRQVDLVRIIGAARRGN